MQDKSHNETGTETRAVRPSSKTTGLYLTLSNPSPTSFPSRCKVCPVAVGFCAVFMGLVGVSHCGHTLSEQALPSLAGTPNFPTQCTSLDLVASCWPPASFQHVNPSSCANWWVMENTWIP